MGLHVLSKIDVWQGMTSNSCSLHWGNIYTACLKCFSSSHCHCIQTPPRTLDTTDFAVIGLILFYSLLTNATISESPSLEICLDSHCGSVYVVWYAFPPYFGQPDWWNLTISHPVVPSADMGGHWSPSLCIWERVDPLHLWYWSRYSEASLHYGMFYHRSDIFPLLSCRTISQAFRQVCYWTTYWVCLFVSHRNNFLDWCPTCGEESVFSALSQFSDLCSEVLASYSFRFLTQNDIQVLTEHFSWSSWSVWHSVLYSLLSRYIGITMIFLCLIICHSFGG